MAAVIHPECHSGTTIRIHDQDGLGESHERYSQIQGKVLTECSNVDIGIFEYFCRHLSIPLLKKYTLGLNQSLIFSENSQNFSQYSTNEKIGGPNLTKIQ